MDGIDQRVHLPNDSPPGNVKPLGYRCTVRRVELAQLRQLSSRPLAEIALDQPRAWRTRRPRPRAMGAAVSRVRSIGGNGRHRGQRGDPIGGRLGL
ncbi:MAG: hypothetical protein R2695_04965 [Acidimicrobiales bacterium]